MDHLAYKDKQYELIIVQDHMEKIANALTAAVNSYYRHQLVAIDFSALRARGEKTSHTGVASGPASFAKTLDEMISSLEGYGGTAYPVAILNESHADFEEFRSFVPKHVIFLARRSDGSISEIERPIERRIGFWEMSQEDREAIIEELKRQTSPWSN